MNTAPQPPPLSPAPPPPSPGMGLAIVSLVVGILALLSSVLLVGGLLGLIGLVFGALHLARRTGRNGLAWAGIALSALGILVSIGVAAWVLPRAKAMWESFAVALEQETHPFKDWKGVEAPDFTLKTLDGTSLKLSDLRGRRVILNFWATWCPPCVKEIPHFIQLRKEIPEGDLAIVGISNEDEATLREFVRRKGINYPIASADDLPAPYREVSGIPTTFFIDRRGVIQEVLIGYHDLAALRQHASAPDTTGDIKTAPSGGDAASPGVGGSP
ncbi:MAG: TlpA disulfide reductase family protein [Verrucomicrobiales bacterium]|nr:TlpA disulfide reductase family protein [Verrucomicrobiales bacterium]